MIRRCVVLVFSAVLLTGCALPNRSVVIVSSDTLVCVPPTVTVIHTEYRVCGADVPVELLKDIKPSNPVASLLTLRP